MSTRSSRYVASAWAISAAAALLGAACTAGEDRGTLGSEPTAEGARDEALAGEQPADERTGEGELLQRQFGCAQLQNGFACGGTAVPGDSNTLYRCWNGAQYFVQVCPNQCVVQPPPLDDYCI